jgi:hypothetical protein
MGQARFFVGCGGPLKVSVYPLPDRSDSIQVSARPAQPRARRMSALMRQRAQNVPHLRDISLARLKRLWANVRTKRNQAMNQINLEKPCTEWPLVGHGDSRAHVGTKWNQGGTKHQKTQKLVQKLCHPANGRAYLTKLEPSGTKHGTKQNFRQPRTE